MVCEGSPADKMYLSQGSPHQGSFTKLLPPFPSVCSPFSLLLVPALRSIERFTHFFPAQSSLNHDLQDFIRLSNEHSFIEQICLQLLL